MQDEPTAASDSVLWEDDQTSELWKKHRAGTADRCLLLGHPWAVRVWGASSSQLLQAPHRFLHFIVLPAGFLSLSASESSGPEGLSVLQCWLPASRAAATCPL